MPTDREIMDEIYGIRERIYEKIKHMSHEEQAAYFAGRTEEIEAELGVKFRKSAAPLQTTPAGR